MSPRAAGNDIIKNQIVEAVSVLFHISSYKVKVLKMEDSLNMKKVFQKNQMIIMTLAVVIAVAGYVNYSQKYDSAGTKNSKAKTVSKNVAKESAAAVTDDVTDVGEAVLTNAQVSNYVAKAKLEREQTHSKAKDTLEEIIKDQTVKDSVKQDAVDKLAMLSEQMEMETAAENLLGAKGFLNSIVTITNGKVDVLVNKKDLSKVERSQIEDIVVRKVGCQLGDVVISSIKTKSRKKRKIEKDLESLWVVFLGGRI